MVAKGSSTEFLIPQLTSGQVFYFKARAYDDKFNYSDVTDAVSAVSGFVQGGRIEGGTIDLSALVDSDRPIRIITNLPVVVSADDPDYKVGMLINYFAGGVGPGELRRLVSTTGVPATDWIKAVGTNDIQANSVTANEIDAGSVSTAILVADAIKTNMIEAGAVTADEIATGTITADRIAAKTITAGQIADSTITGSLIADSEITGSKISGGTITGTNIANATINGTNLLDYIIGTDQLANSDIQISNSTKTGGAFSVRDGSNTEVLRLGNISSKGVGANYGLWGALGTGVFIEGTFRIVRYGSFNIFKSTTTISNGSSQIVEGYGDFEGFGGLSVTVPTGRLYELLIFPRDIDVVTVGGDEPSVIVSWYNVKGYRSVNETKVLWDGAQSAGTYSDIGIGFKAAVHNASGSSKAVTVGVGGTFFLVDYDASLTNQDIVSITT
jgi:hypothetical protein